MSTVDSPGVMNPYWAATTLGWLYSGAVTGGVTHINATPAHPFAAIGEYWLKFDGNNANHTATPETSKYYGPNEKGADVTGDPPSGITRVGIVNKFLFRVDAAPGTRARLCADGINGDGEVWINTDLTIGLDLKIGSLATQATSTTAVATATNYEMEVWEIAPIFAAGLTPRQICVRISTLSAGGTGTTTTLINGTWTPTAHTSFFGTIIAGTESSLKFGENNARGAGFLFYIGNVYRAWEDADAPSGIIRVDRLDPNGVGHNAQFNGAGNPAGPPVHPDSSYVDESGTAETNQATDYDDLLAIVAGTKKQTYTLSAQNAANTATIYAVQITAAATYTGALGKTDSELGSVIMSDGTTDKVGTEVALTGSPAWLNVFAGYSKDASAAAWTWAALTNLEAGLQFRDTGTSSLGVRLSTVTTLVAYSAAGETMPVVPAAPPHLIVEKLQAVNRAATF